MSARGTPSLLLLLALMAGCTPPSLRQASQNDLETAPFAFLADGRTTREDVIFRLGTPSAHFEGERILTYAYAPSGRGWPRAVRYRDGTHGNAAFGARVRSLVLVFGADGLLARHALVVAE